MNYFDRLDKGQPSIEQDCTSKEQVSLYEYIIRQKRPLAEISLKIEGKLMHTIFLPHEQWERMYELNPEPEKFLNWLNDNCSVSYYEPLCTWRISVA
jgi:hypothetical protein